MPLPSGLQREFEQRRCLYLESILRGAVLKSKGFEEWKERDRVEERQRNPQKKEEEIKSRVAEGFATLCDAVREVGLDALNPGLESINEEWKHLSPLERARRLRAQLDRESKFEGLARVMLVRADPKRQDELFAWPLVGLNPDAYWANKIDPIHMEYLIDTADFGANEFLRLLYLCGEIPAHLRELDLPWRAPEHRSRDPNFSRTTEAQIRDLLLSFKYWIDDPFRAEEFTGAAQYTRENNRHEKMEKGREMTFWSENHRILFATVEYLAGQFFPDEIFTSAKKYRANPAQRPGDMVGRDHTAHARPRVLAWLNECLRLGFAEWCAPGYFEQDLLALFNLADFALEEEVRTRAAMALDLMVFEFARFSMGGAFASSTGRAYFESKNCVWEQSIRDTMEILFGSRGHFVATTGGAVFLATSTGYRPPDVLLAIGASPPKTFTDRSRVSINLDEAGEHGIGFDSDDDVVFWWSRAGYATKETIDGSRKVATKYGLMKTPPFGEVLDLTGKISGTLSPGFLGREALAAAAVGTLGRALCGPGAVLKWAALGGLVGLFVPGVSESDVANLASVITEGSLLTRANLYSHRIEGALLSSVQNFRPGQVNFQSWPCVASLGNGALVWTSYPSAGSTLNLEISLAPVRGTTGGILGKLGGGLLGPIGAIAGAIGGYTLASKNSGPVAELEIAGRKPLKDIKIEETIFKSTHDGPNWWTGNAVQPRVVQMRSAAIIAYQAKTIQRLLFGQRTHAWFPKNQFDEVRGPVRADKSNVGGVWFFGRAGDGYLALFSANNAAWNDNGPWKDKEILSDGGRNVFIMQIGNREQFGDFGTFMKRVCGRRIHVNGLNNPFGDFQCSYDVPEGQRLELHYDDDEVHYGGVRFSDDFFPRFRNPFARVAWQQSRYAIQHKNYSLLHDIAAPKRLAGVRLEALTHDTPLLIYAQNVALLPQAPVLDFVSLYKGTDRERALALIIEILTSRGADVVGLSEVWMNADCDRICSTLRKIYPFWLRGPRGGFPSLNGGGLLLLSRHPIIASHETIFRHCSGDDCLTSKGVLHACVQVAGHPCALDVFLSHTQAPKPTIGGSVAGARRAARRQIRHLAAFISACRDTMQPALLMGDLNVDSFGADQTLYNFLVATLGNPQDLQPAFPGSPRAIATSEREVDDVTKRISSFFPDSPPRAAGHIARFGPTAERLDYLLSFPGRLYEPAYGDRRVIIHQLPGNRDLSDHYGLEADLIGITQRLPHDESVTAVRIQPSRFFCLKPTAGFGDDEVEFTISAVGSSGQKVSAKSRRFAEVDSGLQRAFGLPPLTLTEPGDTVWLSVSGTEKDIFSDDALGTTTISLERDELLALRGEPLLRMMPLLTGEDGEYAVELEILVD